MRRSITLKTMFTALGLLGSAAIGHTADVGMIRLDCGEMRVSDLSGFSDTENLVGRTYTLTDSCYLVRHGADYLLWNTGLPTEHEGKSLKSGAVPGVTMKATIGEQLATLGIKASQIKYIGISHYHFDHIGQMAAFPQATLLIGAADWKELTGNKPGIANPTATAPWKSGGSKLEELTGDKDLFGDGSVSILALPGHTPGHRGLLVRLKDTGPVLLTGDLAHFAENYERENVPKGNTNRAETLASFDRFKKLAANLKATVIVEHEPADIAKLPAFPKEAR